jgi:hypothetical protein
VTWLLGLLVVTVAIVVLAAALAKRRKPRA